MKQILRNKSFLALLMLIRVLFPGKAYGSHTMGADLTYECMGGNTYKVTLSFYRDCIGIPAPANPVVTINSSSCGQTLSVTCYMRPGTGQEVTPVCSSSVTTCNGGAFTGIQEWVYDGIVTLPMQCADWTFGYSLCCRNAAITTINSPSSNTFYIYSTLNNLITPCNSSPTFSNKPVPFLCLGQQFCFNHGAFDADGDSLVYRLITPKQTASTNVVYHAPYNASNPLNSSPATTFNTVTGDICLTPQAMEVTVMAVLVEEYRNGVKIGSVERDLQLTVMNCNNNLPSLTGINGTNDFSITVCANAETCFNIFSNDPDSGQHLTVNWNYSIPGATFNSSSALHPVGTFCWTPSQANVGNSYTFTATVTDDACPYFGSQTYAYTVHVIGINVNAGPDQAIACSDLATLTAVGSGGSGSYTYLWSTGSTMQSITVGEGTYWVTASDGNCTATDTVAVTLPFIPVAAFTFTPPGCNNAPVAFTDQSTTPGGALVSWSWNFGDGATSTLQNPTHQYAGPGTYTVSLIIENNLGCIDTAVQQLVVNPMLVAQFSATAACANSSVNFTDLTTSNPVSWNWNFGDGGTSTLQNPVHTFNTPGIHQVTLIAQNALGCIDTVIQPVNIYPLPLANAGANQNVCSGSPVTLTASGGISYNWTPIGMSGSTVTFTPGASTNVVVQVTDANGCVAYDTVNISVLPRPNVNAGADQSVCSGGNVTLTATGAASYTWTPGGSTSSSIVVNPSTTTTYTVTGTGANGCTATDAVTVQVFSLPVANAGADVNSCSGSAVTLTATGGGTYVWSPGGATTPSITVNPAATQTYQVTVTNGNSCTASDAVTVNVNPRPVVSLQSFFLCVGSTATLDAGNPGSTYLWNTGATTQTIQISNGGTFSVTVTDPNGCTGSASTSITYDTTITINLGNVSFCQGDSAVLDAGYPGLTYSWSPGGQTTQTISVFSSGTYGVTVTDTTGCSGSITITATENPLPNADFNNTPVCVGNAMSFTDGSTIASGAITNWQWDFGDGATSSIRNPVHNYAAAGNYNVSLTATSAAGCAASVINPVIVNPLPVAGFSFANACLGSPVTFTDNSTIAFGNIATYNWNFGDGNTSSQQNPSHTYSADGNYTVTLQVTSVGGCSNSISYPVTVSPIPVAAFAATTACLGAPSSFNNLSSITTGTIASTSWDFNDTYSSSQNSPAHTYLNAGTFQVKLIVTSALGCSDTLVQPVTVNPLPAVNAGSDQSICNGGSATLTATSGASISWMPGGMNTYSITVSPTVTTTYTATVTDVNGCTSSDAASVFVGSLPTANAGSDKSVCSGNTVTLNGTGGNTYSWSPGGMTTASVTVLPAASADYILTVTDANGCQDRDTVHVNVLSNPVVSAGPDQDICQGSTVSLTASGASGYLWNPVGQTAASILVSPGNTATYTVIGTAANGCTSSDSVTVVVRPVPVISLGTAFVCAGSSITLDAGNPGASYDWSTGETTQTILVSDSGNYTVTVTSPNGCPGFGSATVIKGGSLNGPPSSHNLCAGSNVTLDAGNPGSTYLWSNGQTTRTILVNSGGSYQVSVTDTNGCSGTVDHIVISNPIPVAAFSTTPDCAGNNISFTNNSSVSSGTIQSVLWNFGDGFTSSSPAASHSYTTAGTYPVSLIVTTNAGCTDSMTSSLLVHPLPVAGFTAGPTCANESVLFTDNSSVISGSIAGWHWDLGDGTISTSLNPVHHYNSSGNYTATLVVTTDYGCRDTLIINVSVLDVPTASFMSNNVCAGNSVNFLNNSSSNGSPLTSYAWDFGNGGSAASFQPSEPYAAPGNYTVTLVVTAANGCSDTTSSIAEVYSLPTAEFSASDVCFGTAVNFQNSSTLSNGSLQNFYWNFGDNTSSSGQHAAHNYSVAGTYNVALIVASDFGCVDTVIHPVTVHPMPQPAFNAQNVCVGTTINFNNTTTVNSGTIAQWNWTFNDNSSSTAQSPNHLYASPGTYHVTLTATTDNGCQSSVTQTLNVYPEPVADFATSNVCIGNSTQFLDQSTLSGGGNFNSTWNFGDGSQSALTNPMHTYLTAGNYNVTLSVTSANGCTGTYSHPVDVYHLPVARFAAPSECTGAPIHFTNSSTSQDGQITSNFWSFGDGTYSVDRNPVHTYSDSGTYHVELITVTNYGCLANVNDSVSAYPNPEVNIQVGNSCAGTPVSFSGNSNLPNGINYAWSVSNGYASGSQSFNQTIYSPGSYHVTLTATTSEGCTGSVTDQFIIHPVPVALFAANEVCEASATRFENQSMIASGQISTYAWDFGDSQQSGQVNPTHTYNTWGDFNATLSLTSSQGCTSNVTRTIHVHPKPVVSFNAGMQGCSPVNAFFSENSSIPEGAIASYLWNFSDGHVSTDKFTSHVFNQSGTYDATLSAVSDFGCVSSYTQAGAVTVYPGPVADFTADPLVTDMQMPLVHFYNQSENYATYQWVFGDGTSTSTELNPTHTFADTGTYTAMLITVTNQGCTDTVMKKIDVRLRSTLWIANCFTPNGDGNNDDFRPFYTNMEDIKVWVYDRWGLLLTYWNSLNGSWDGYYQGKRCQQDTYVYKIVGKGLDGKQSEWVGHVSLVY